MKLTQPALIPKHRLIPTIEGRPHQVRVTAPPADRTHPKRPRHGDLLPKFRAYITFMCRKNYGRVWMEIDLNKIARACKCSIRWAREIRRRLMTDPIFTGSVVMLVLQKRYQGGGASFVLIAAHRCNLRWDCLPLMLRRDHSHLRHVRDTIRGDDVDPDTLYSALSPGPILTLSTSESAVKKNIGARAETQSTGPARDNSHAATTAFQARQTENKPPATETFNQSRSTTLRLNLNKEIPTWEPGRLMSIEGRKKLQKKAAALVYRAKDRYSSLDKNRYWDNCKVPFLFNHVRIFIFAALRDCQPELLILRAWDYAIHQAHADCVDGMAEVPPALALAHGRRWLAEHTTGTQAERVNAFYQARFRARIYGRQNFKNAKRPRQFPSTPQIRSRAFQSQQSHCRQEGLPSKNILPRGKTSLSLSEMFNNEQLEHPKSHPEQVQTGGSPGAIGSIVTRSLQPQKPVAKPLDFAVEAARKSVAARLHEFALSLDDIKPDWVTVQAKKHSKKS